MRTLGTVMMVIGLVVGLAISVFLFQWDSSQRAAAVTPTPAAAPPATSVAGAKPGNSSEAAGEQSAGGATQAGQVVYNKFCNGCHPNGKAGVGPKVTGLNDEVLKGAVRKGRSGGMPAFGVEQITEAQLTDLLAYVKSLK